MFTFIFLVYLYIIRIRGCDFKVFVSYDNQNLLYYNMKWFGVCCVMVFIHFLCICCRVYHLVPCELIAIQYPLFLAINRSMQSSSTPIVLLQPPYHHLNIQDDAHNILCISYVHIILTTNIVSVSNLPPYGQTMLDLQQDTFSYI